MGKKIALTSLISFAVLVGTASLLSADVSPGDVVDERNVAKIASPHTQPGTERLPAVNPSVLRVRR